MTWTNCVTSFPCVNFFRIFFHYKISCDSFIISKDLFMRRDTRSWWKTKPIYSLPLIFLLLSLWFFIWPVLFNFIFTWTWSKLCFFALLLKSNFFICKSSTRFDSIKFCGDVRVAQTLELITTWSRLRICSWGRLISFC